MITNAVVLSGFFVFYAFFYRWDNKTYDDLAENVNGRYSKAGGGGLGGIPVGGVDGEIFMGDDASNIESLLGKDDASIQYMQSGAQKSIGIGRNQLNSELDITLIPSRIPGPFGGGSFYSRRNSIMTNDRIASLVNFGISGGGSRYPQSDYNFIQEDEGDDKQDNDGEAQLIVERPRSWAHLFQTLYSVDEYKLFKLQNADGYFYLLFLKYSAGLFSIMSFFSLLILLPSYTVLHDSKFNYLVSDIKNLDKYTLSDSLQNPQVVMVVVIFTILFTVLAYFMIIKFSQRMSDFQFVPQIQFVDNFAAMHSVMIRGINKKIGVQHANEMIRKVFDERFPNKVVQVQTIRNTDNVQNLFSRRQIYQKKYKYYRGQNSLQGFKDMIIRGSRLKCNRQIVDAEAYYEKKLELIEAQWQTIQELATSENIGVAFVSFKEKDCVVSTIDEIDIVQTKLVGKPHYEKLHIQNWEVEQAYPASDIIWTQMNKGKTRPYVIRFLLSFLPTILSVLTIGCLVYIDNSFRYETLTALSVFNKYLISMVICIFNYYLLPYIIFKIVQIERNELKSAKEQSYVSKNIILMILNSLLLPYIIGAIFTFKDSNHHSITDAGQETPKIPKNVITQSDSDFPSPSRATFKLFESLTSGLMTLFTSQLDNEINEFMARCISNTHEFFMRFILQVLMIAILWQIFFKPRQIIKSFHEMLTAGQKYKFKHWFYDIGFRNAIAVSLFIFTLFFSITIPLILPIASLIFFLLYYVDKYNLIYIYPIDFESKGLYRRSLIIYSIMGILLFQLEMFIISGSVLSKRINIYLFAFLVIQSMVVFTVFEFIRKPWEGKEHAATIALQQQANNLLDSISSYNTDFLESKQFGDDQSNIDGVNPSDKANQKKQNQQQQVDNYNASNEKMLILKSAYENPLDIYFLQEQENRVFQGVDEELMGVNLLSPKDSNSALKSSSRGAMTAGNNNNGYQGPYNGHQIGSTDMIRGGNGFNYFPDTIQDNQSLLDQNQFLLDELDGNSSSNNQNFNNFQYNGSIISNNNQKDTRLSEFSKRVMKTPVLNRLGSTGMQNMQFNLDENSIRQGSMDKFRRESTKTQQQNKHKTNLRGSPLRGGDVNN
eukprot:403354814